MGTSSQTTENEPPEWFSEAAKKSLLVADQINQAGYVPYMGNQVAAFAPQQVRAMQSISDWDTAANGGRRYNVQQGLPRAKDDGSGIAGYGSYAGLLSNLEKLQKANPAQYEQLTRFGGDLLAKPGTIPRDIANSPWNVGAAANSVIGGSSGMGNDRNPTGPFSDTDKFPLYPHDSVMTNGRDNVGPFARATPAPTVTTKKKAK
jgi:hypothetical protein